MAVQRPGASEMSRGFFLAEIKPFKELLHDDDVGASGRGLADEPACPDEVFRRIVAAGELHDA
jgi:hypothetical protein